jgi:hypothetical protein
MRLKTDPVQAAVFVGMLLVSTIAAQPVTETAASLLHRGSTLRDSSFIRMAVPAAATAGDAERLLFTGTCLYRLQAITYVARDKKATARYGEQALNLLDSAEAAGADSYSVHVMRAYVSQIMAGLGITYGPEYGPLIAKNHKVLKMYMHAPVMCETVNNNSSPVGPISPLSSKISLFLVGTHVDGIT